MGIHGKRVTVVVAGAGARGGYEAGTLSVLVPRLRAAGYEPTVYIGTSAGAINVTLFAAFADLPAAEQADQVLGQWRRISVADIYRSPILTFPCIAAQFLGQFLRVPGVRFTHLLDTAPLEKLVENSINIEAHISTRAVMRSDHSRPPQASVTPMTSNQPPAPLDMALCMQLDNFGGDISQGGQQIVDWARQYPLVGT